MYLCFGIIQPHTFSTCTGPHNFNKFSVNATQNCLKTFKIKQKQISQSYNHL